MDILHNIFNIRLTYKCLQSAFILLPKIFRIFYSVIQEWSGTFTMTSALVSALSAFFFLFAGCTLLLCLYKRCKFYVNIKGSSSEPTWKGHKSLV